jgi:DNA-binding transcriptional LysR family regulator
LESGPLLPTPSEYIREIIETACAREALNCRPIIESDDSALLWRMTRQGAGPVLDLPLTIRASVKDVGLVFRPFKANEIEPGNLFVGQMHKRSLPVAARKFAEQARDMFEQKSDIALS